MRYKRRGKLACLVAVGVLAMARVVAASPLAYITNADDNTVSVLDTDTDTVIKTITGFSHPVAVSINPAGTRVYVTNIGGSTATVDVVDTQTNTIIKHIAISALFATFLNAVAVNPTMPVAYATVSPDQVRVIDTSLNTVATSITLSVTGGQNVVAMTTNAAGTTAYATSSDGLVSVIDAATNMETTTIPAAGEASIVAHPSAALAYSSIRSAFFLPRDTVTVIDTGTNAVATTIPVGPACQGVAGMALNPSGSRLYAACANTGNVVVIDTTTNMVVTTIPVGNVPDGLSMLPDGSRAYVANAIDNTVSAIDTTTNMAVGTIPVGDEPHSSFGPFIGPDFVCGNGSLEPGEACDDGNLTDDDGCDSTCKIEQDFVVLPLKPITLKIAEGKTSVAKTVKVKVRNANLTSVLMPPANSIQVIANTTCTGFLFTPLDFGTGTGDVVTVAPGDTVTGVFTITAPDVQFTSFNLKAPNRCTFTLTAHPTKDFTTEKNATNDVALLEVNVLDKNDAEGTTVHETTIASAKPVKLKIRAGNSSVTKAIKLKVGNADYLPVAEDPSTHSVAVTAMDGTCPSLTVGSVTFEGGSSVNVKGGKTATGVVPITLNAAALQSPSVGSPARCTATLTAVGPAGDSDASNNTTQLVIDVIDANDIP